MRVKAEVTNEKTTDPFAQISIPIWQELQQMPAGPATETRVVTALPPSGFGQPEEVHTVVDLSAQTGITTNNAMYSGTIQDDVPHQDQTSPRSQRVPLPPQNSQSQQQQLAAPTGPMSSQVTIPPRPRPGRKPLAQEEQADKRRLQNRLAQRNFRDKRQQKLAEALREIEANKREYEDEISSLKRAIDEAQRVARRENDQLRDRALQAEKEVQRLSNLMQGSFNQGISEDVQPTALPRLNTSQRGPVGGFLNSSVPTPPEDGYGETDFTSVFARPNQQKSYKNSRRTANNEGNNNNNLDFGMDIASDRCGFCTDDQNCSCRQENNAESCAVGSGTCEACQRDPNRAQMCRELASVTRIVSRPSTSDGPRFFDAGSAAFTGPMLNDGGTLRQQRTSCSAFIDQLNRYGERTSSVSELFSGQLHAYPAQNGGYEIEEHEAAQVLHSLSRRNTVVTQPESNERASVNERLRRC